MVCAGEGQRVCGEKDIGDGVATKKMRKAQEEIFRSSEGKHA